MKHEENGRRDWSKGLLLLAPALLVAYLVIPPLILLIASSLRVVAGGLPFDDGSWSFANYAEVVRRPDTYQLFQNSIIYAFATVALALSLSAVIVWLIERTDLPGKATIFALVMLPIAIPGLVKAIGWSLLANPNMGLLNSYLRLTFNSSDNIGPLNIYSLPGLVFVSALSHVPSVTLMIAGAFRNFDPAFEEAGQMSGAGWLVTQLRISLPLLKPSLLAAFIYFFAYGLEDFQIPSVLGMNAGIQVFSTRIYLATHPARGLPDFGLASAYSMFLFLIALGLIMAYRRMLGRAGRFAVISGKGYRPVVVALGPWKYVAIGGIVIYLLLAAVLPILTLLWVSLQPFVTLPTAASFKRLSLINYLDVMDGSQFQTALINTLIIGPIVATLTMTLGTLVAWNAARGAFRLAALPDTLAFMNMSVPTVVFGLAIIFLYLGVPILRPVYGTIWILIIAFTTRYLTYSTRLMSATVIQIHESLEEAADMSGASRFQVLTRITVPLMLPSILNGWLWVAVQAFRESTLAVMLLTPANVVLASLIWSRWQEGSGYGAVAAISLMSVALTGVLALASRAAFVTKLASRLASSASGNPQLAVHDAAN